MRRSYLVLGPVVVMVAASGLFAVQQAGAASAPKTRTITAGVGEDRFTPFAVTVRVGQRVKWVNVDTDDHSVTVVEAFDTAGHDDTNQLLPGTVSNGGQPGRFTLVFNHPGTFIYRCRFHSRLDEFNQPAAPGPDGGNQDANGNFGTPMMGVITVQ